MTDQGKTTPAHLKKQGLERKSVSTRMYHSVKSAFASSIHGLLVLTIFCGQASAFDMRECRLGAITFVDPWNHATFKPDRVGVDVYYFCGSNEELVENPDRLENCRGPYGDIFLQGTFHENGQTSQFLAVYSYHKGASPCCGWSVFASGENTELEKRATWLASGSAPRLGEWPFASIANSWGSKGDLDGVVALICDPEPS